VYNSDRWRWFEWIRNVRNFQLMWLKNIFIWRFLRIN